MYCGIIYVPRIDVRSEGKRMLEVVCRSNIEIGMDD